MCILIMRTAGQVITKKRLKACWVNNPDGGGVSWVNTDHLGRKKLITYKSMDFNKFYKKIRRAERLNPESNMIIHTRIGTSGELSTHNCHPFQVSKGLVMAHNGVISAARRDPNGKDNDTRMFIKDTVKELPSNFMDNTAICDMMGSYIGFSKLIFFNVDNEFMIINEDKGEWIDGVWYSNSSYKTRTVYKTTYATPVVQPKCNIRDSSWVECDYCGTFTKVSDLIPYQGHGYVEGFCTTCDQLLTDTQSLGTDDMVSIKEFIKSYNKGESGHHFMT